MPNEPEERRSHYASLIFLRHIAYVWPYAIERNLNKISTLLRFVVLFVYCCFLL